jgi:hypothetical protein
MFPLALWLTLVLRQKRVNQAVPKLKLYQLLKTKMRTKVSGFILLEVFIFYALHGIINIQRPYFEFLFFQFQARDIPILVPHDNFFRKKNNIVIAQLSLNCPHQVQAHLWTKR